MNFDLLALGLIAFFALLGALSGFARQVAQAVAGVAAVASAGPLGRVLGHSVANALQASLTVGIVAATLLAFVLVYLTVRALLTALIRRLMGSKDGERVAADRFLGFCLAGVKAGLLVWIGVSAATFVENNLVLAGKKYSFTPRDSKLVALSRDWNFIELVQFSGAKELALALKVAHQPRAAQTLKDDPDYAALMKDTRFRRAMQSDAWKKALETGDVRALMANGEFVELLQDPTMANHLEGLADHAD